MTTQPTNDPQPDQDPQLPDEQPVEDTPQPKRR